MCVVHLGCKKNHKNVSIFAVLGYFVVSCGLFCHVPNKAYFFHGTIIKLTKITCFTSQFCKKKFNLSTKRPAAVTKLFISKQLQCIFLYSSPFQNSSRKISILFRFKAHLIFLQAEIKVL